MNLHITIMRTALITTANRIMDHCRELSIQNEIGDSLSNKLIFNISKNPHSDFNAQKTTIQNLIISDLYNALTCRFRVMLKNMDENPSIVLDKKVLSLIDCYMNQLVLELDVRTYYSDNSKYVARPAIESQILKNLTELELNLVAYCDPPPFRRQARHKKDTDQDTSIGFADDFLVLK